MQHRPITVLNRESEERNVKKTAKLEQTSSLPTVHREKVAKLAYEMWLTRKAEHGHDVEDWLAAERLLMEELQR